MAAMTVDMRGFIVSRCGSAGCLVPGADSQRHKRPGPRRDPGLACGPTRALGDYDARTLRGADWFARATTVADAGRALVRLALARSASRALAVKQRSSA